MVDLHPARTESRRSGFERLAGWSYRHRRWALALWVVVLAAVTVAAQGVGDAYRNDFSLPGTESQRALDTLRAQAPARAGDTVQIVFQAPAGLDAAPARSRVAGLLDQIRALPHVVDVRDPYRGGGAVSGDRTIGYATVTLDGTGQEVPVEAVRRLLDTARSAETDDLRVEVGGNPVRAAEESSGGAAEGIGLLAALIILVLLFRSLLAASLPLVIAIFAVGAAIGLIALASHVATVADFTVPLMVLVGLGVGIDYALLVFSRFRAELIAGADPAAATRRAMDTAGRTVLFAGCTVIIALLGLITLGLGSLQGVAVAIALTVLATMLASLTLLPALLGLFGHRIQRAVHRRARRATAATSAQPPAGSVREPHPTSAAEGTGWRRWADLVHRHRWAALLLPAAALLALALPALDLRLGFADAGNDAGTRTGRQAYDLLAEGFGPGFNGPLLVVVQGTGAAAGDAQRRLAETPGVAAALPPTPVSPGLATVVVFPDSKPQAAETAELVTRLRQQVLPPVARDTGATFLVGGFTAAAEDFAGAVADRLPLFVVIVVGLSALLLTVVFRSLLIPVKAAVLNLLSVAASIGVITAVFQYGLFGVEPGPIESYVPVMIFAIVFGLSMDYEVFLLARMHEEWRRGGDAALAVREGLATTGRVVTAAAAIMIVVFGAFLLSPDRMLQQFGLGLAVAILLDAFVIRCLILPAAMRVLGARAWWLPRRLDRWLPHVPLEHR